MIEAVIFNRHCLVNPLALSTFRKKEKLVEKAQQLEKLGYSKELVDNMRKIININRKIEKNGWHVRFV